MNVKIEDRMTPSLQRMDRELRTLIPRVYDFFKQQTPIRTGAARKQTQLKGSTIHANYAYAERLDQGYSKQAPEGMIRPTEQFIKKELDRIFRK